MLARVNNAITKVVKVIVVVMATIMVAAILWQVFMRYVFNSPPSWSEELALLLFSWSMLLMTAVGVREAFHVNMDLFIVCLPPRVKRALRILTHILIAAFGAFLVWGGVLYAHMMHGGTSAAIGYPIVSLYSAAPVSGVLIVLYSLEQLVYGSAHDKQGEVS